MCNGQLIAAIYWPIQGIIGVLITLRAVGLLGRPESRIENRLSRLLHCPIYLFELLLGIPLAGVAIFALSAEFPSYASAFTTLSMLGLALIAVVTLKKTIDIQNAESRLERIEEVIKWATEVADSLTFFKPIPEHEFRVKLAEQEHMGWYINEQESLSVELKPLSGKCVYIKRLMLNDPGFRTLTVTSTSNLERQIRLTSSYHKYDDKIEEHDGWNKALLNLNRNHNRLYSSVMALLKKAGDVKSVI